MQLPVKNSWLALIAGVFAFLLYANTIGNDYAIDDNAVIAANPYVQQGLSGIGGIFSSDVWVGADAEIGYYRPLPLATFAIEHQLWGDNPHVSHFINALLYALTAWLLCMVLMTILSRYNPWFVFATVLLFIAHPIHTEVVANIKSRDELLQFLCFTAALYFLLRVKGNDLKWLAVACFFYYLALLSKETALIGVVLVPGILYFATELKPTEIAKRSGAFVVVLLLFLLQKNMALGDVADNATSDIVSFPYSGTGMELATALTHVYWYIKLLILPYPLSYNYAYNQIPAAGWGAISTLLGAVIVLVAGSVVVYGVKKKSLLSFGLFILFASLIPAMGFVLLKGGILAERFLYVPCLGFCMLLCYGLFKVSGLPLFADDKRPVNNALKWLGPVLILLAYSFTTVNRNRDWKDDLTIASTDVQVAGNSCQVRLHYGKKLIDLGVAESDAAKKQVYFADGMQQLYAAVSINPHYARAYFKMGYAYQALRTNADSAAYYYQRAIDEAPGYALAYKNLGLLYLSIGRQQLAEDYLDKALQINPNISGVAQILNEMHNAQPAAAPEAAAIDSFTYYSSTGVSLAREKRLAEALENFKKALSMKPESVEALVNIATCYGMMNNYSESEKHLLKAEQIDRQNKMVLQNLSILYKATGNKAKEQEYRLKLQGL